MEGRVVGSWELREKIDEGGMGAVYLARHVVLDIDAVVKVASRALSAEPEVQTRFLQEARTQAGLRHIHIVQVLDFFDHDGQWYLVSEHLENGSLAKLIARSGGPVAIDRALDWMIQVLDALDFAHRRGVIHRDVKPSNILLDLEERAKVTDFGIAVVLGDRRLTRTGVAVGTPQYMSPEQISRPRLVDHRTDVYSVGLVLYELITGRVPFDSESEFEVQHAQVNGEPTRPRELNPAIPEALEEALLTALAKDPDRRFPGGGAFARALREIRGTAEGGVTARSGGVAGNASLTGATSVSGQASPAGQPARMSRSAPLWVLGLVLVASLVLLIATGSEIGARGREIDQERLRRVDAEVQAGDLRTALERAEERAEQSEARVAVLATLAEARAWPIVIADGFSLNLNNWQVGESSDTLADELRRFQDGRYRWSATAHDRFVGYSTPSGAWADDCFASVEAEVQRCTGRCNFGLSLRASGKDRYLFRIEGSRVLIHMHKNDAWTLLLDRTEPGVVRAKGRNRLEVIAVGSVFRFFVNGQKVGEVSDPNYLRFGEVQIAHGISNRGDSGEIAFDNFEVRRYRSGSG